MQRSRLKPLRIVGVLAAASLTIGFTSDTAEAPVAYGNEPAAPRAPHVALQAGHWLSADAPDELARLRSNGTRGGGKAEWEVTLRIAELTAERLRAAGVEVDVLPTTIPPRYRADLFISIHADGIDNGTATGFSIGASRRDRTGQADRFVEVLADTYHQATGLRYRTNVTRRMVSYYAFNTRRYQHSLDPATPGVVLETGFLTSASDRRIIVDAPERSADGIAAAVLRYFEIPPAVPPVIVAR